MAPPLRVGLLGAAPIAIDALLRPRRHIPDVLVAAVAARDEARARRFAARYRIPQVHQSYAALISDPSIDAVYIPLPNSLHAQWTIRALRAGKHVLCEKPLAANADEAEQIAHVAAETGLIVMEAFHYRYHPLATRLKTIIESGEIGRVQHLDAEFSVPLLQPRSIQYRYDLGGGATMDVGCYAINLLRFLADAEPRVTRAKGHSIRPQVDRLMQADFQFDDQRTARMTCALLSTRLLRLHASVYGTAGTLRVTFPFLPHILNRITVQSQRSVRHEQISGATTYAYQLRSFIDAVRSGTPPITDVRDAIANMRVIDAVYERAGFYRRGL